MKYEEKLTEVIFILYRSGCMATPESDSMIKNEAGQAHVSTVLFSSNSIVIYDRADVQKVVPMTVRDYYAGYWQGD